MHNVPSLRALQHEGILTPVDVQLAELTLRLTDTEASPLLSLALALASQWPQRGHTCLDLDQLTAAQVLETQEEGDSRNLEENALDEWPSPSAWRKALSLCQAVGSPDAGKPFVLWQDRWLYLRRYWDYEQTVARLVDVSRQMPARQTVDREKAEEITAHLFNVETLDPQDHQHTAVLTAASSDIFILTGGPGTGKTTTVLRILALLLQLHPEMRIALAAPTGKAALRLQESIALNLDNLPCQDALKATLPRDAQTLHRLLGHRRHLTTFRHDADHPLPHDLVVVDEASMMDLGLLAKLIDALRPGTRLLLVGDRFQLPSVDAGAVFGALCAPSSPLPKVELTRNYRFTKDTGIGAVAAAVLAGDEAATENALTLSGNTSCQLLPLPTPETLRDHLWQALEDYLEGLAQALEPEAAFSHMDHLRVLCAHRTGPYGSLAVNELVHDLLISRRGISRTARWFPGRPLLITENDYAVELFNGDTGVLLPYRGRIQAFFRDPAGGFRRVPPARLPAHESAYAMTVHKSQGSEFDQVLLLLTDRPSRLLTRELLYTGITRARAHLQVWSPPESLRACVRNPLHRTSGLPVRFEQDSASASAS